jgi:hypothetical protein
VPGPIVEFFFARYARWLSEAERIAQNRLRETKSIGEGRKRLRFVPTTARSRAGTRTDRRQLDQRYDVIRRAARALVEAEMARQQGETQRTIAHVSQTLGELEAAGAGIPEHSAIALLAYVAEARAALSAGDVERLAAADYLLEHEASALRRRTTLLLAMATQRRQQGRGRAKQQATEREYHRKLYRDMWKDDPETMKDWAAERIAEGCRRQGRSCTDAKVYRHLKGV